MDINRIVKHVQLLNGIQDLDELLDARERLRRTYSFFVDAYRTSGDKRWLVYARHIAGAGQQLNAELDRWVKLQTQMTLWTDGDDDDPLGEEGGPDASVRSDSMSDMP